MYFVLGVWGKFALLQNQDSWRGGGKSAVGVPQKKKDLSLSAGFAPLGKVADEPTRESPDETGSNVVRLCNITFSLQVLCYMFTTDPN